MNKRTGIYAVMGVGVLLVGLYVLVHLWIVSFGNKPGGSVVNSQVNDLESLRKTGINKLYGNLYQSGGGSELAKKISLLQSAWELGKSSFLSSFVWDYSTAMRDRKAFCSHEPENKDFCSQKQVRIKSWKAVDEKGDILGGVTLSLNGTKIWDTSRIKKLEGYNGFVHRVKFSKKGYLDYYSKVVLGNSPYTDIEDTPRLLRSNYLKTVKADESLNYNTQNFAYQISSGSFVNKDGTAVTGDVDVYFFDINANNGDLNVLNLDIFDDQYSFLGSSFTTLGMPLIKAYSGDTEVSIVPGKVSGTGKIQNTERAPGMDLANVPKNVWLTPKELDTYKIPPFWFLDQNNGVWRPSKMKILDTAWNYEFNL